VRARDQRAKAALRARATCSSFVRFLALANPPRFPSATARGSFLRFSFEAARFLRIPACYYPPSIIVKSNLELRGPICATESGSSPLSATRLAFAS